jgi:hypothetical protein
MITKSEFNNRAYMGFINTLSTTIPSLIVIRITEDMWGGSDNRVTNQMLSLSRNIRVHGLGVDSSNVIFARHGVPLDKIIPEDYVELLNLDEKSFINILDINVDNAGLVEHLKLRMKLVASKEGEEYIKDKGC